MNRAGLWGFKPFSQEGWMKAFGFAKNGAFCQVGTGSKPVVYWVREKTEFVR